ncbi:signal transduction protein [Atlantibacter subterraneus]|uniref:Signal transduction protein n=2 Tax=Atlantibacter subterraneus TaxID=255519 RepID=A0A3R9EVR7_9ENTR|nr:signal transduction protein [Atlantibacter subterranea]RSE02418.1 signal transduction protein [Atlantibacter subterranea]RSE22929.1 signal transduction protein [Atlantibacter subterranea]
MITQTLPAAPEKISAGKNEILMITNADLRESANLACWPMQEKFEAKLQDMLGKLGYQMKRAHAVDHQRGHGFISSQRQGSDLFAQIDENAPLIVLLTAWQYSHHVAPSLVHHKGPILLLANFDGTWPGLVGMLCLAGSLTSLGKSYSRLWSENFDDELFVDGLKTWLRYGSLQHSLSYLHPVPATHPVMATEAGKLGRNVGEYVLRHKEIIGLFDTFCMGMINGVFPQQAMVNIGMPIESLSQSALLVEMAKVPDSLREECLQWYIDQGMDFRFGEDGSKELTREQVKEQCAMMIAMARFVQRFGLSAVGVQYQQGLKDSCAASDFAEGAIGSTARFPLPDEHGNIICDGQPIPCINEVDMGTAIPQTMLWRLLSSFSLPAETTLHDIRWGSEYNGTFYWDLEISGAVPFEHLKGGIKGATGYRQPAMYFPYGGSTICGQGKAGRFIWARAHYEGTEVIMHIGTGRGVELPEEEFERRHRATCYEWPLLNAVLDGVGRDELMAGHQSNHLTIAYVDEPVLQTVFQAFVAQALTQGIRVAVAGTAIDLL